MKNETQFKRKLRKQGQRILSWFLSFTMVLSAMTASVPPLQVAAAGYEAEAEEDETVSSVTAAGVEETASDDAAVAEEGEETVSDNEDAAEEEAVSGDEAAAEEETVSDDTAGDDVTEPVAFEETEPAIDKNGGTEAVSYIYREWTENGLISENRTVTDWIPLTDICNMNNVDITMYVLKTGWYVVSNNI